MAVKCAALMVVPGNAEEGTEVAEPFHPVVGQLMFTSWHLGLIFVVRLQC